MGNIQRGIWFYRDQVIDRYLSKSSSVQSLPYFVAGECTPYVAPDGMVQPVQLSPPGPVLTATTSDTLARYNNHYSYLQSTSDHYIGPEGPYDSTCYEATSVIDFSHKCYGNNSDNVEEVRVITDKFVYVGGLVSTSVQNLVNETVKGKCVCFRLKKGGPRIRRWIWRRVYHRLSGFDTLVENDYIYRYVLR